MSYLPRSRDRNSIKKPALIALFLFAIGALVMPILDGAILSAVSPIWKGESWAASQVAKVADFLRTKNSLTAENNSLKERLAQLEVERAARFSMPVNEESLGDLLGRRRETGGVIASTLVKPPQSAYDTIVIDAGTNEGISTDFKVLMPEGPTLGIVTDVGVNTAKVRLFSAPGVQTHAVLERHGIPVILEGAGGGNFKITLPRETDVQIGDRILSADVFSSLLAIVGEVRMEPTDSFKEVFARSPINIFNIHLVLVRP